MTVKREVSVYDDSQGKLRIMADPIGECGGSLSRVYLRFATQRIAYLNLHALRGGFIYKFCHHPANYSDSKMLVSWPFRLKYRP